MSKNTQDVIGLLQKEFLRAKLIEETGYVSHTQSTWVWRNEYQPVKGR